jgi:hypothetical protein
MKIDQLVYCDRREERLQPPRRAVGLPLAAEARAAS